MARDTVQLGGDVCHPEGGASRSPETSVRIHIKGRYIPSHVQFATSYLVRMLFWYLHQEKAGRGMQHEGRPMRK